MFQVYPNRLSMASRHLNFEANKFCQNVSPLRSVGFCLQLALGRGSRGETPQLLLAAKNGHDSVVERLLEAKAAVDEKDNEGRGLGQGLGGKFCEAWDRCDKVDEMWMIQFSGGCCFQFSGKRAKQMHQHFVVFIYEIRIASFPSPRTVKRN